MSNKTANVAEYTFRLLNLSDKQCLELSHSDVERFWSKVRKTNGCWLWTGALLGSLGYGQFSLSRGVPRGGRVSQYAHRLSWALSHGSIPNNQHVLHSCDVPRCVNPAHLFLGTHRTNMEDAARKGRLHVPRPSRRKLTEPERADVRRRYAAGGTTLQALADEYNVTRAFIWQIVHRRGSSADLRRRSA
jgi:hypothetical protein